MCSRRPGWLLERQCLAQAVVNLGTEPGGRFGKQLDQILTVNRLNLSHVGDRILRQATDFGWQEHIAGHSDPAKVGGGGYDHYRPDAGAVVLVGADYDRRSDEAGS